MLKELLQINFLLGPKEENVLEKHKLFHGWLSVCEKKKKKTKWGHYSYSESYLIVLNNFLPLVSLGFEPMQEPFSKKKKKKINTFFNLNWSFSFHYGVFKFLQ